MSKPFAALALALVLAGCGSDPVDYYNLTVPEHESKGAKPAAAGAS
jgi:ABC-type uncharacterized transport system auxiliary subunit